MTQDEGVAMQIDVTSGILISLIHNQGYRAIVQAGFVYSSIRCQEVGWQLYLLAHLKLG
jgi:hypothetical protein